MYKIFSLVIVLVAYATTAFATEENTDELQAIARVVENMAYVTLCSLNYTSKVERIETTVTVTFVTTQPGFDANGVCDCVKTYMAKGVGTQPTATAKCILTATSFTIIYTGKYDPAKDILPPLKKLADAIEDYPEPELGGYKCSQKVTESESGWVCIKLKTKFDPNSGKKYQDVCNAILSYLIQGDFLQKTKTKCSLCGDEVVVNMWSDE